MNWWLGVYGMGLEFGLLKLPCWLLTFLYMWLSSIRNVIVLIWITKRNACVHLKNDLFNSFCWIHSISKSVTSHNINFTFTIFVFHIGWEKKRQSFFCFFPWVCSPIEIYNVIYTELLVLLCACWWCDYWLADLIPLCSLPWNIVRAQWVANLQSFQRFQG